METALTATAGSRQRRRVPSDSAEARRSPAARGALAAASCYLMWGLVPLYWTQLSEINPVELIAHRHVGSLVVVAALVALQGMIREVADALRSRRILAVHLLSGTLLTVNWLVYVWGVNTGHVIETSLGYFLVPLANVAAGRFLLHEHLRRWQWVAIGFAAAGVAVMVAQVHRLPWIALILAVTFSSYGVLRKRSPLGSLTGLTVETLLLSPVAVGFLVWQQARGMGALGRVDGAHQALLLVAGLITAVPLLMFAYGARRIRLSTLGLLQYLGPTTQFSLGLLVYREAFSRDRMLGFGLIWTGLVLYTADNLVAEWRKSRG
ncbi:MAG: EamA family transporter RarD [Verrucomicrobiales bacterium]|nr:EamA family transporter RarD [Verrucomicrobiales bacterium]